MYKISGECGFKVNISETGRWTHEWIINEHNYNRDNFQWFLNMRFLNMPIRLGIICSGTMLSFETPFQTPFQTSFMGLALKGVCVRDMST